MRHLELPLLPHLQQDSPWSLINSELDKLSRQPIDHAPWSAPQVKPEVTFAMAHNSDCLFLKYYVTEPYILARYRRPNDPVYKDSCVEFFIAFEEEQAYYNFEFNCLGTCRLGFGANRTDRQLLSTKTIASIRHFASLQAGPGAAPNKTWHLTLAIPTAAFSEHCLTNLQDVESRVNFYKCGDELPEPHFLTWNMIHAPEPDFHLPDFFGTVKFLSSHQQPEEHVSAGHSR